MTQQLAPTEILIDRMRTLRKERGWSVQRLADRCAEVGGEGLNRSVLANLESGRRDSVTLEELTVLSLALDVAPVHLLVPFDPATDVQVLPDTVAAAGEVRAWFRGERPLDGVDAEVYERETPGAWFVRETDYGERFKAAVQEEVDAQQALDEAVAGMREAAADLREAVKDKDEGAVAVAERGLDRAEKRVDTAADARTAADAATAALERERAYVERGY